MDRIYLSAPDIGPTEERYVLRAMRSGWVAPHGPDVDAFEREIKERAGVAHAVATTSGTAALHLALLALGIGPGCLVAVPTLTFIATANAVTYTGATPIFVDTDPDTGNIDVDLLATLLERQARAGRPIDAVIPVDLFGSCADYARLVPLCRDFGVPIVEDAAEALGASRDGRPAGSFGAAAVLSFNGNKIMTTSGGGMVLTDSEQIAATCKYLATQARQPVAHYEHLDVGYNYRLSNVLAALGRAQLSRLDDMIESRRDLRGRYLDLLAGRPGVRFLAPADADSNCWLTAITVDADSAGWTGSDLAKALGDQEIETRPMWKPMHRQPVYADAEAITTGAADDLYSTGLVLPSGSALTPVQRDRVLDAVNRFLSSS